MDISNHLNKISHFLEVYRVISQPGRDIQIIIIECSRSAHVCVAEISSLAWERKLKNLELELLFYFFKTARLFFLFIKTVRQHRHGVARQHEHPRAPGVGRKRVMQRLFLVRRHLLSVLASREPVFLRYLSLKRTDRSERYLGTRGLSMWPNFS